MKSSTQILFFLMLVCGSATRLGAQANLWARADRDFEQGEYRAAAATYEEALLNGKDDRAMERVAQCYLNLGEWAKAAAWYAKLATLEYAEPQAKKTYADLLKMGGNYELAQKWYEEWGATGGDTELAARLAASCAWAKETMKSPEAYSVRPAPFNSSASDISPVYYDAGIVFASNREMGSAARVEDAATQGVFYDLYYADLRNPTAPTVPLKGKINSDLHDGQATFSPDGKSAYFTKSLKSIGGPADAPNQLTVMSAHRYGRRWRDLQPLPFNNLAYSCGHPTLSPDGSKLYFSSDAPGGFGGADLYVSTKIGEAWGEPENLGPNVNSPGDELFPFLHRDGTLFFASDGLIGYGGLDIYFTKQDAGKWAESTNAGFPLNSSTDDFAICFAPRGDRGYFSSDRTGTMGSDDIYYFERQLHIEGQVLDSYTHKPVAGVKVRIMNAKGGDKTIQTDADGRFSAYDKIGSDFMFALDKQGYKKLEHKATAANLGTMENLVLDLAIERNAIWNFAGKVQDAQTGLPLSGVTVSYTGGKTDKRLESKTDGTYRQELGFEQVPYTVVFRKRGYEPVIREFSTEGKTAPEDFLMDVAMTPGNAAVIIGTVVDKSDGKPVGDAFVRSLADNGQVEVIKVKCRPDGTFHLILKAGKPQYLMAGNPKGFFSGRMEMPYLATLANDTTVHMRLELVPAVVGATAKVIYFDYNKADLRKTSETELLEIVRFLQDNPTAKVELSTHTDARGSTEFNEKLSQRRAESAVKYIVGQGIGPDRISAKGYGESQILNQCHDGVDCNDDQHGINRRCELTITGIN